MGNRHALYTPHGHFQCQGKETWVAISVQSEQQWRQLIAAVNDTELSRNAALDANARKLHRQAIEQALETWTRTHTADEITEKLTAARVQVAAVATYQAMSAAPWRQLRALTRTVEHPYIGRQDVVVPPWRFAGQTAGVARPAPLLGADTVAVMAALDGQSE